MFKQVTGMLCFNLLQHFAQPCPGGFICERHPALSYSLRDGNNFKNTRFLELLAAQIGNIEMQPSHLVFIPLFFHLIFQIPEQLAVIH